MVPGFPTPDLFHMSAHVEVRVVHPDRAAAAERDLDQPLAQPRDRASRASSSIRAPARSKPGPACRVRTAPTFIGTGPTSVAKAWTSPGPIRSNHAGVLTGPTIPHPPSTVR